MPENKEKLEINLIYVSVMGISWLRKSSKFFSRGAGASGTQYSVSQSVSQLMLSDRLKKSKRQIIFESFFFFDIQIKTKLIMFQSDLKNV